MADDPHHGPPSVEPARVRQLLLVLYAVCAGFVLVDVVAVLAHWPFHKHGHYDWEQIPGFHAGYGFISCVLLVLAARELRKLVMRGEDYYDA